MFEPTAAASTATDPARERVRFAAVGRDIELAYETFGNPSDPPLLLVMGLGVQMLGWDEEFCELLAGRGFHVIRFDNRDVGLSTKVGGGRPNIVMGFLGRHGSAHYRLHDMADDTAGLIDHLDLEPVHLVGASMGGMIGQTLAARHPDTIRSLVSIMAGPGGRRAATMPRMSVLGTLLGRPPSEREAYVEHVTTLFGRIGSPDFEHDPERVRRRAELAYDRCFYPVGTARQLMAIIATGDRTDELRRIRVPTLAIHGREDPLSPPAGGEAVADAIPGARLELIDGMGHDLPVQLWPRFAEMIEANAARAA